MRISELALDADGTRTLCATWLGSARNFALPAGRIAATAPDAAT
jgi:hypothetical protein